MNWGKIKNQAKSMAKHDHAHAHDQIHADCAGDDSCNKPMDLVYLYSDPIVNKEGYASSVPLDLETEYKNLVDSLTKVGRQFNITREAINIDSLKDAIDKNPFIIHISSHGAFDKKINEFYLAIENYKKIGQEDKIPESRLKKLLGDKNKI